MDGTDDVTQIVITPGGMTLADWRAIYEGAAARLTAPAWDAIDASAAAVARIVARARCTDRRRREDIDVDVVDASAREERARMESTRGEWR